MDQAVGRGAVTEVEDQGAGPAIKAPSEERRGQK